MTPTLAVNPQFGWCPSCMTAWRPTMIAVNVATNNGSVKLCGACVKHAARLVDDEQARRDDAERAVRRGQDEE